MRINLLMVMVAIIIPSLSVVWMAAAATDMDDEDGSMAKASSEQYPSFSSFDHQQSEFGMRKTNPFDSSSQPSSASSLLNSNSNNGIGGDSANDYSQQQQSRFEPNLGAEQSMNNFREFGPSIYNMPSMSGESGGGMDGGQQDGSNGGEPGSANQQDMGSFTPVSLSVEEAFRKYFPNQKDTLPPSSDDGGGGYSQQQLSPGQGHQLTSSQQQQSLNGYSNNAQQPPQQLNDKEVGVNIDSLREIVEKEPLAKPNPFDPPSPPLSAFLPPPPNSQLVESNVIGPSGTSPPPGQNSGLDQYTMNGGGEPPVDQAPRTQMYISQGPPPPPPQLPPMPQFKTTTADVELPRTQTFMGPMQPPETKTFMYTKDSESLDHGGSNINSESTFGDEGDEEGYAYNTEDLDENGKKVSMLYSRPVMPELGGKFDYGTGNSRQQLQQPSADINTIYRKPVSSYEDDTKPSHGLDQTSGSSMEGSSFGDQFSQDRPYHNEITIEKPMDGSMYPPPPIPPPITGHGSDGGNRDMRPPPSVFADFQDFDPSGSPPPPPPMPPMLPPMPPPSMPPMSSHQQQQHHHQQQQQQQQQSHQSSWSSNTMDRPSNMMPKMSDGPQQIEYGGFVPIKKPISGSDMSSNNHLRERERERERDRERDFGEYVNAAEQQKPPYEQGFGPSEEYILQPRPAMSQQQQQGPPPSMHQMRPPASMSASAGREPSQQPPSQEFRPKLNLNFETQYHGPGTFDGEPSTLYSSGPNMQTSFMSGHHIPQPPQRPERPMFQQQQQQQQQPPQQQQQQQQQYINKIQDIHVKPLYGRDAMKKLRELGINEDEFYGTVNKILQKSRPNMGQKNMGNQQFDVQRQPHLAQPQQLQPSLLPPYMPKANLYRQPPKNRHRPSPSSGPQFNAQKNLFFPNNMLAEDIELKFLNDQLPPGASYNPRDVGLDESVLAQIHLLDSGIGGYRFSPLHQGATGAGAVPHAAGPLSAPVPSVAMNYLRQMSRKPNTAPPHHHPVAYGKKPKDMNFMPPNSAAAEMTGGSIRSPHAMNSMIMPFIFPGSNMLIPHHSRPRLPYSATNTKGFYPVYGYRAAASELKPQFMLPPPSSTSATQPNLAGPKAPFKFLHPNPNQHHTQAHAHHHHPHASASANIDAVVSNPFLSAATATGSSDDIHSGMTTHSFANIFGIRSIKGIKSLVSYLTGGVSG